MVKTFCRCFLKRVMPEKVSSYQGVQRFGKLTAGKGLHAPKRRALPTAPHPGVWVGKIGQAAFVFVFVFAFAVAICICNVVGWRRFHTTLLCSLYIFGSALSRPFRKKLRGWIPYKLRG